MNETPNGLGPWFCALLFNTSLLDKCKTQTHLAVHTFPHLYADWLNSKMNAKDGNCWVVVLKIGPFKKWVDARNFHASWSIKTRGKIRRLERGLELLEQFQEPLQLQAWGEFSIRDQCLERFASDRRIIVKEEIQDQVLHTLHKMSSNYEPSLYGAELQKYDYSRKKQKK